MERVCVDRFGRVCAGERRPPLRPPSGGSGLRPLRIDSPRPLAGPLVFSIGFHASMIPVRGARGASGAHQAQSRQTSPDVHEGLHAEAGALAAEAGLLEAAEGDRGAGHLGAVDRDHAELQRAGHAVEDEVGAGQERAGDVVGDLLGDGAGRAPGKAAVEVAAVDRRGAGGGAEGGVVEGGDDDDGAGEAAGSRLRARSKSAIGPSYSSPWLPPVSSAVGPGPPRITAIGIITLPQALSSRL